MDSWDDIVELTNDDLAALRIVSLAIALTNTRRPLSTTEVRRDLYPDLQRDAFKKAFLRDRERLALTGLVIRELPDAADESRWYIDEESTFVRENPLSQQDALLLDFLLLPLASDPALPYARELQLALAKIDRSFDGSTQLALPQGARARSKALSTVESALIEQHALAIVYDRADGTRTERVVAPFGLFTFRAQPYLVAARVDADDRVSAEAPHTYNVSRLVKVTERPKLTYEVPADFDIRDFVKLPFQMGDPVCQGVFANPKDGHTRTEEVHDMDLAAAWALSKGLVPTAPAELVDLWARRVRHMGEVLDGWHDRVAAARTASCAGKPGRTRAKRRPRTGRPRNAEKVRELVTLIGSLCTTGDTVTLDAVSGRLGCSTEEARALMEIVCGAGGEESGGLLISCNDDETEFTLQYPGTHGRPVKLNQAETVAVMRALDAVGIVDDDPLRAKLSSALTSPAVQIDEVRRALGTAPGPEVLTICAQAQAQGTELLFSYRGTKDPAPRRRRVAVRALIPQQDTWHVRAYDFDIGQDRTFRTDRMTDASLGATAVLPSPHAAEQTSVTAYFLSDTYYTAFEWYHINDVRFCDSVIQAQLPYYGEMSTWLPRRIIACGGALLIDDEAVLAATRAYWKTLQDALPLALPQ